MRGTNIRMVLTLLTYESEMKAPNSAKAAVEPEELVEMVVVFATPICMVPTR